MKKSPLALISICSLCTAFAMPPMSSAQDNATQNHTAKHHHYKLIDIGTLGGPGSSTTEGSQRVLTNGGTLVGGADTPSLNPYPNRFNPFNRPDSYVQHAFVWQDGVLTDLGILSGGSASFPYWINSEGVIAGGSELQTIDPNSGTPEFRAVLWQNHQIHDLGTLGGTASLSVDVNNRGLVTGFALNASPDPFSINCVYLGICPSTQTHAFLWTNGKMHDLGTLGGADSFAQYINDSGQIAGVSYTSDVADPNTGLPQLDPFLWENGKMKDLGNFGGTNDSLGPFIFGLNNRGQVIGIMSLPGDQFNQAFLWDGEKLSNLGTLGGNYSLPTGINDAGEVVGGAWLPGDQTKHAFLWRKGIMTDLGAVDGDPCSFAESINSMGQVVGASQSAAGGCDRFTAAFLWENGGPSVDLNTLVPPGSPLQLAGAAWINERGEITGGGVPPGCDNGDTCGHAYLLIPCDENHPNVEGCDYSLVDEATVARQVPLTQITQVPTAASEDKLSPAEMMTRFRSLSAGRNRRFGIPQTSAKTALSGEATISVPSAILSPTSLSFSIEAIGVISAAKIVTLKNAGTTSLTITAMAIGGTNARDFAQTHTCGSSLAVGASCNISVTFKPTASGTRAAALRVTDNAAGSPQQVTLSGIGTTAKLSPVSLSFSTQAIGTTSAAKSVTFTNVGATALTITSIAVSGTNAGDFVQTHTCGSSLAAGATCGISVTFRPTASGARSAALSITDNAAGSPQQVALGGTGTTAKLFPTSLNFGTVSIGTISPAKTVTLTNVGTTTLSIAGIAITGINAEDFAQTHTCGSSLAAGATCSVNITFKPKASGTRTASLSVSDNAAGTPQAVSLMGNCPGGNCLPLGAECPPQFPPCCPGLRCVPAGTRAFCE